MGFKQPRATGLAGAGWFSTISFDWITPLFVTAHTRTLEEPDAKKYIPPSDDAYHLSDKFHASYRGAGKAANGSLRKNVALRTLLRVWWPRLLFHAAWTLLEVGVRLIQPVLLFRFLAWLQNYGAGLTPPEWQGWLLALALWLSSWILTVQHLVLMWLGHRTGFAMRQQCIAAVHAKALRLNASSIAHASTGHVVNLVSNDVRRFDDAMQNWVFVWAGPLELVIVFGLVSLELGVVPAILGIGSTLLLIPAQAFVVRTIGSLRRQTALKTDARIKFASEFIQGALAMKMLSWEKPFFEAIRTIRSQEASLQRRTAAIKAINSALEFLLTPLTSFVTFTAYHFLSGESFNVPSVFYALALLSLPRTFIVSFFLNGVQYLTELRVSLERIERFLSLPEPPNNHRQAISPSPTTLSSSHLANGAFDSDAKDMELANTQLATRQLVMLRHGVSIGAHAEGMEESQLPPGFVAFYGADYDWQANGSDVKVERPLLSGISFTLQPGELLGIAGAVGSGKSSILAALLGELQPINKQGLEQPGGGSLMVGMVAYCSQNSWIMHASLRDNILFGEPFDEARYRAVVASCSLDEDFAMMPVGDATEIGERGVNLSGGQKARVALARAAYSQAHIQLLDDPLSAVDARVGRRLFDTCIGPKGLMAHTTRVLLTHQRQFLPRCDRVLVLRHGRVLALGTWQEVAAMQLPELTAGAMAMDVDSLMEEQDSEEVQKQAHTDDTTVAPLPLTLSATSKDVDVLTPAADTASSKDVGMVPPSNRDDSDEVVVDMLDSPARGASFKADLGRLYRTLLPSISASNVRSFMSAPSAAEAAAGKLTANEDRAQGTVPWSVYIKYLQALSWVVSLLLAVLFIGGQAAFIAADFWLSRWARAPAAQQEETRYVIVYAIITGSVILVAILRAELFYTSLVKAATAMHNAMAYHVLRAPLSFFHTNPTGRVLNRFSKDQGQVDDLLPFYGYSMLQQGFLAVGAVVLVCIAVPVVVPVFVPIAGLFWWYRCRYLITSREVKRLEAVTRSPVYASFSATLKGLTTIRAYSVESRFHSEFLSQLSLNGSWWFCHLAISRWMSFRFGIMTSTVLGATALLAMAMKNSVQTSILGLALTYTLQLTTAFLWFTLTSVEVENHMTSVERLQDYARLPSEPPGVDEGGKAPPKGWPSCGELVYEDVTARYRPGLPPVLKNLSFVIKARQSCGVVGRTGSGKSSLLLTLFRLIDIDNGRIFLDGVETGSIGLDALRRSLAIIPQDPVLFTGSFRSNLDPWSNFDDAQLWRVLEHVQLKEAISSAGGLDSRMAESGDNLSVGQRQLFCLARALLQDAKILALDEATANVDRATDALVQQTLRSYASGELNNGASTSNHGGRVLLVIAHRIDTIMDCDTLLVLSNGNLVEQGPPSELAARPEGTFGRMVAAARASGS